MGIEKAYGKLFRYILLAANPVKKAVIQTECITHKFINFQALEVLKNDNFVDAYNFFSDYIDKINEGVVWADLDLKSSGHFYNPDKDRGLYGNNNAMSLAVEYYSKALKYWDENDYDNGMFYLGAAVHLVQDMTIPQHANIRLLDNHRQYENFVKRTYLTSSKFIAVSGGYYIESIQEAIKDNARTAMSIYKRLKHIKEDALRFYTMTKYILPLAQKTTAGCFMMFYRDISKNGQRHSLKKE